MYKYEPGYTYCLKEPELDTSWSSKHRFYLETIAIGVKSPQDRTGLNSECSKDNSWFTAKKTRVEEGVGECKIIKSRPDWLDIMRNLIRY